MTAHAISVQRRQIGLTIKRTHRRGGSAAQIALKNDNMKNDIENTGAPSVEVPRLVRLLFGSKDEWDFAPFGDFFVFTVSPVTAPNILRRVMQRIIMGSRYRLIENRPLAPIIISEPNSPVEQIHNTDQSP